MSSESLKFNIADVPYQSPEQLARACSDIFESFLRRGYDEILQEEELNVTSKVPIKNRFCKDLKRFKKKPYGNAPKDLVMGSDSCSSSEALHFSDISNNVEGPCRSFSDSSMIANKVYTKSINRIFQDLRLPMNKTSKDEHKMVCSHSDDSLGKVLQDSRVTFKNGGFYNQTSKSKLQRQSLPPMIISSSDDTWKRFEEEEGAVEAELSPFNGTENHTQSDECAAFFLNEMLSNSSSEIPYLSSWPTKTRRRPYVKGAHPMNHVQHVLENDEDRVPSAVTNFFFEQSRANWPFLMESINAQGDNPVTHDFLTNMFQERSERSPGVMVNISLSRLSKGVGILLGLNAMFLFKLVVWESLFEFIDSIKSIF